MKQIAKCEGCGKDFRFHYYYRHGGKTPKRFCSLKCKLPKPEDRFWTRVNKEGPLITRTPCWLWTGSVMGCSEYGSFWIGKQNVYAHRFSYEIHKGQVPSGMVVMHACDNPKCVNPEHLSAGTSQDNATDSVIKGRSIRRRSGPGLPDGVTAEFICELTDSGLTQKEVATKLGIHTKTVQKYVNAQDQRDWRCSGAY